LENFVKNNIDTGWLDRIIVEGGIKVALVLGRTSSHGSGGDAPTTSTSGGSGEAANDDTLVIIGVTVVACDQCAGELMFLGLLERGQLPPLACPGWSGTLNDYY
jgi:hypothetical protein